MARHMLLAIDQTHLKVSLKIRDSLHVSSEAIFNPPKIFTSIKVVRNFATIDTLMQKLLFDLEMQKKAQSVAVVTGFHLNVSMLSTRSVFHAFIMT